MLAIFDDSDADLAYKVGVTEFMHPTEALLACGSHDIVVSATWETQKNGVWAILQYPFSVLLQNMPKTTPVGFEPTRGDPIGLAGRRLSHSAKVSVTLNLEEAASNDASQTCAKVP